MEILNWIWQYKWGLLATGLALLVIFKFWHKAEILAAGRWAGALHLILQVVFTLVLMLLLFVALWAAKVFPVSLIKAGNNAVVENQAQLSQLPPLGTIMPVWGGDGSPTTVPPPGGSTDWKGGFIYEVNHPSGCATERTGPNSGDPEVACIPNGIDVCVLEFVSSNTVEGRSLRGHIRAGGDGPVVEGWVHNSALSLPAIKPCP